MYCLHVMMLCLVVSILLSAAHAQTTFQHPGVLNNQERLQWIKAQVEAKAEPQYTAFQKAMSSQYGDLSYTAQGPPADGVIDCGSYSHPDFGCSADNSDSVAAYVQSLLWIITGNKQYASNVIKLLNKYASSLKQFNNTNAPLQTAWSGQKWTRAAEIIRYSNAGWADSDIAAYAKLLTGVYLPMIYGGAGDNGNWELSMIDAMFGIAVFTDDFELFNHTADFWKQRVPSYFYYEPLDGDKPVPAPRGTADWYGETVFNSSVNGLCQETCRDMGHTQLGLSSAISAAETAYIQGLNLYETQEDRILAALEFNSNILLGAEVPSYLCGTGKVIIGEMPTWEIAYNQFHNRSGHSLPHTWQQITTHVRVMNVLTDTLTCVWETLTHGDSS